MLGAWAMGDGTGEELMTMQPYPVFMPLWMRISGIDTAPIVVVVIQRRLLVVPFEIDVKVVLMTKVGLRWDCEEGAFSLGCQKEDIKSTEISDRIAFERKLKIH